MRGAGLARVLGAILAVCLLYRVKILTTVQGVLKREPVSLRFAAAIIVAFLPWPSCQRHFRASFA